MGTRIRVSRADTAAKDLADKLEMSTAEIGLSVRTTNCLEERGIFTVNDLLQCTPDDLLSISNFGEKTLEEVYKALEGIGFYRRWKREAAPWRRLAPQCVSRLRWIAWLAVFASIRRSAVTAAPARARSAAGGKPCSLPSCSSAAVACWCGCWWGG